MTMFSSNSAELEDSSPRAGLGLSVLAGIPDYIKLQCRLAAHYMLPLLEQVS